MNQQQRAVIKQALEALELNNEEWKELAGSGDCGFWKAEDQDHYKQTSEAITALRQLLEAEPVQEPVAWMQSDEVHISLWKDDYHTIPLYTTPPAQPAPVREPAAWRLWDDEPGQPPRWQYYDKSDFKDGVNPMDAFPQLVPLYPTPQAQPEPVQEPVAHPFEDPSVISALAWAAGLIQQEYHAGHNGADSWLMNYADKQGELIRLADHRKWEKVHGRWKPITTPPAQPTGVSLSPVEAQPATAPGYCKQCKQYTIDEPMSAQPAVPLTDEQPVELVRIEHWQQDTMESGHWEKTREMPRHIAEKLLHHFDQASIITAAPIQGETK